MRSSHAGAALAIVAVALAGCTGPAEPQPLASTAAGPAGAPAGPAPGPADRPAGEGAVFRYEGLPSATSVVTEEGRFGAEEHWWPAGAAAWMATGQAGSRHRYDIGPRLPRGLPARVVAEVQADLARGDLDLWFQGPPEEFWSSTWDTPPGGWSRVEFTVVHGSPDPVEIVVVYDEPDPAPEVRYTLTVTIATEPGAILPGTPATLELPGGAAMLDLQALGDGPGDEDVALLRDPADRVLGRFPLVQGGATITLGPDAPAGRYVLMTTSGSADVRASLRGASPGSLALGTVRQTVTFGPEHAVPSGQELTWAFDLPVEPLQAGFALLGSTVVSGHAVRMEGPGGVLIDWASNGHPWLMSNGLWLTGMGQEGLAPGSYTVTFTNQAAVDVAATHVVVGYER